MNLRLGKLIPMVFASLAFFQIQASDDGMKPNGCKGTSLCHAYPEIDSNHFHFDIGFLVEQMRITGTDYAMDMDNTYNQLPHAATSMLRPEFDLEWGITCGFGYHFTHDDWFLAANFDWLRSKGKSNATSKYSRQIVPINVWKYQMISGSTDVTYFNSANSTLTADYFNLDVDLNKGVFLTGCFSFEPHAGLQVSWIYYDQNTTFTDGPSGTGYQSYDGLKREQDTNFWGIGPQFGLDSMWYLAEGFSFFADNSIALLFGQAKVSDDVSFQANITTFHTNVKDNHDVMSPAARSVLGFRYDKDVYCDKQHISLKVGLDTRYYWNQFNQIDCYGEASANGAQYYSYPAFRAVEDGSFGTVGLIVDFGWDF